jgi:hypothetical protein
LSVSTNSLRARPDIVWHTFATHGVCPRCSKMWHARSVRVANYGRPTMIGITMMNHHGSNR